MVELTTVNFCTYGGCTIIYFVSISVLTVCLKWRQSLLLLYSWCFSRYSTPIHWLVHCHMTSNNETVLRRMPWAGNITKTMLSNRKQFSVTCKMLTAVGRHLSITWLFVFHQFDPFALQYNKSLNDWSVVQWILFPLNFNVFLGNKSHCSSWDQSSGVYYCQI